MRILWVTNIALPPLCEAMGWRVPAVGGWMYSALKELKHRTNSNFAVATVYPGNELVIKNIDDVRYYLLPLKGRPSTRYNSHLEEIWSVVFDDFRPDVTHIHGSEFPHGLALARAVGSLGLVLSIQGIVSGIARYYTQGINPYDLTHCRTLRDVIKHDSISRGQAAFECRGKFEKELFASVNHIIGRTNWDKAHAWALNPDAQYHYCGETMREAFYHNKWSYSACEPHLIFVSQASYPIKGLHMLLQAMPLILKHYPDTKIRVAGSDPTARPWWSITSYGKYLKRQIERFALKDHVEFTGMLSEQDMCREYLRANVFVCPSSIENSPNSLGEAQLLGVPYVASYVGGIPDIVNNNPDVLYRFEETEMLANKICQIFSQAERYVAPFFDASRYDAATNATTLLQIYTQIAESTLKCK